ncbi:retinaldehyde-binding protein 1-like isoform X2 [Atheta coriaria]|uniref:retinaldehyde-binding protein 1-like isoform X2 n=1 Tax=Dalotia coriaria TaxID=877792 RepID=UPI0031F34957
MDPQILAITDYQGNELKENDVKERLQALKVRIKDDHDINNEMRQDDDYLLRYLHFSDFNIQQAHLQFKKFYKLLTNDAKWFGYATPKAHQDQLQKNMRLLLDTRDRDGRLILIAKMGNINPSQSSLNDVLKLDDIMMELGWDDPITLRKGFCGILDVKDMGFRLMQWATPKNLIFAVKKLEAMPVKDLKIHCVNKSRYLSTMMTITWPFLPAKFKENIYFHEDKWESLHKYIDPASLPTEYGGTNTKSYDEYIKDVLDKDNQLVETTKYIKFFVKDAK